MKKTKFTKILSLILCFVLVAAVALLSVGCGDKDDQMPKEFTVTVTHQNGEEKTFTITSDKKTVGEALLDENLITVESGMVLTVDGETVKFEDDGKYWAFYIDGDYALTGVEKTKIEEGKAYAFKVE